MNVGIKITVGENLKRIRKDLGLRQHEVAGDDITRNLISLIENDKAVLYDTAANIMAKNINKLMDEKNRNIFIKTEDLLNPERYDVRIKSNKYIAELEAMLINKNYCIETEKLNDIEAFMNQWDIVDKKVRIYELVGDIFYLANNLNKEYYYYFKALESSYDYPNMKGRYKLSLKLVYNCIITGKNEEAINLCNYMLISQDDISTKSKGIFYYNIALARKRLDEIDECLKSLSKAKNFFDKTDYKNLKNVYMLEGICFSKFDDYTSALQCYNKILDFLNEEKNLDEICATYVNIILIYIKKDDRESVIKYLDKVMIKLPYVNEDSFYITEIYFEISNVLLYLKRYDDCEEYLNVALALSDESGNHNFYNKYLSSLMELYIEANYLDKLTNLLKTLEDETKDIKLNEESTLVLKLLLYFLKQNNNKEAEKFIEDLLNKKEV
ncbi:MAG: helix-turn-helix transcriptional regulator [Tissierellales bacterium]